MPLLGCIADDLMGAIDLATILVRHGMRAAVLPGLPRGPLPEAEALVLVVGPGQGVLAACEALLGHGVAQVFLTQQAGFEPAAIEALTNRLGASIALLCPADPARGRTLYLGHPFAAQSLAQPDAPNLLRALAQRLEGGLGLVPIATVQQGAGAIRGALSRLADTGRRYALVDALSEENLAAIGAAAARHPLVIGSPALALGLPENFRADGRLAAEMAAGALPPPQGSMAVLAGARARATLAQIGYARAADLPVFELDALTTPDARALAEQAIAWMTGRLSAERPVVIAGSAAPEKVAALEARLGAEAAGALIGRALADVAEAMFHLGVGRLLVSGGQTCAAVAERLGVSALRLGAEMEPGLAWAHAAPIGIHLALKSGNAGGRDIFLRAFD